MELLYPSAVCAAPIELPVMGVGFVQDYLGRGVPGVEILAYPLIASGEPANLRTDERGRFSLAGLNPGNYFLALIKPGYQIRLAQANSRLLSLLQLRLDANPGDSPAKTADQSMDWVLRLPRTDVFKEEGARIPVDTVASAGGSRGTAGGSSIPEPAPDGSSGLPVSGEVRQWYSSTLTGLGGNPEAPGSTGYATAVQVEGDLLGRGGWEVRGLAESLNTQAGEAAPGGFDRDQGANRLRLAMHYAVSEEDSLQVRARYDRDSFRSDGDWVGLTTANQAVRTLGYQAHWTRTVGDETGLEVALGYLQSQARVPTTPQTSGTEGAENDDLQDWHWNAQAGYHLQLAGDHRLSLAARTRVYNYDQHDAGWILTPIQSDLSMVETGQRGWALSLSGEDSWQLSHPFSLILGLDTHVAEGDDRALILVPRVGARNEGERSVLQGWILLRADTLQKIDGGESAAGGRAGAGSEAVGYRAEVLRRFDGNWVIGGHVERNPVGAAAMAEKQGILDPSTPEVALVSDPAAWTEEAGISISKNLWGVQGSLESNQGRVVGKMASGLTEAPVLVLEEGGVRYLALRATASVGKTDTLVRLDYTRLAGEDAPDTSGPALSASRVDLMIFQPIPFISNRGAGAWKVLLGFQSLSRDAVAGSQTPESVIPERINRFSGGVGVSF